MHFRHLSASIAIGYASATAAAQGSVTIYGDIDLYANYLHSSSGATIKSLEDGALLRSRLGFRGVEDIGDGYTAKFLLESGFSADTGAQNDGTRFFDRQSWIGFGTPSYGEVRAGRQNTPIFTRGGYIDYSQRTLGSVINAFGAPARFDNDFSYLSQRVGGAMFEGHVALPESPVGNRPIIYSVSLDYTFSDYRVGYMGLRGRPPSNAVINRNVAYDNVFANWMYGKGTVYVAYVRSNNTTANAISNNAGSILGNTGGFNAGTITDLNNFYKIWQISADYQVTELLRIGSLWGVIRDDSGRERGAKGGSIGGYYDLSKRTTLYALVDTLRNDTNGGWRPAGSAALKTTFTNPNDINGRTINGAQLGLVHRF